jgi:outer membrane protein W
MSFKSSSLLIIFLLFISFSIFSQDKIGHFAVGFQSGVLMPFGDNKGIASEQMGISNGLTFKYFPSENFAMGLSLRVMSNHFQGQTTANNVPITQVPFTFDFDWYPTEWRLKPFVGLGAGLSFFTVTPVAGLVNTLKEIPDTYTTPAFLATGRAGLKYQLSDRFSIHGEATYYKVVEPGEAFLWKQNDGTVYKQFSNKASFTLGVFYHFDE